jgi:hypothetical protein
VDEVASSGLNELVQLYTLHSRKSWNTDELADAIISARKSIGRVRDYRNTANTLRKKLPKDIFPHAFMQSGETADGAELGAAKLAASWASTLLRRQHIRMLYFCILGESRSRQPEFDTPSNSSFHDHIPIHPFSPFGHIRSAIRYSFVSTHAESKGAGIPLKSGSSS